MYKNITIDVLIVAKCNVNKNINAQYDTYVEY